MNDLINFLEQHSLDDKLYWRVGNHEIRWERDKGWEWKHGPYWFYDSGKSILSCLEIAGVDMVEFDTELRGTVIYQILYAEMIVDKGISIIGRETMNRARFAQDAFAKQLIEAVNSALRPNHLKPVP